MQEITFLPTDVFWKAASLKVDESALTGESLGVEKSVDIINEEEVPLGDRLNMVYSGSFVTYGRGSFVCNLESGGDRSRKNRKSVKDNFREKDAASDQSGSVWSKVVDLDPCILWYFIRNQYFARR